MRRTAESTCAMLILLALLCAPAYAGRVMGRVMSVRDDTVVTQFPVPVRDGSMIILLSGEGEAVSGMAMSQRCTGDKPPYQVTGLIYVTTDSVNIAAGKKAYVNSLNTKAAPSSVKASGFAAGGPENPTQDLRLYYFAGGQTAGYGVFGLGYERTIKLAKSLAVELDGGITGLGDVNAESTAKVEAEQVIKSLNGRVKANLSSWFGVYTGYRWNEGCVDDQKWLDLAGRVGGKDFTAGSSLDSGTVQTQGLEYGIELRPGKNITLLTGYIPKYRMDFGGIGVLSEPAYTAELRFGFPHRTLRLRGLRTDDYWIADLGVTIR